MGDFNRNRSGSRGGFGGGNRFGGSNNRFEGRSSSSNFQRNSFGGGRDEDREMFSAVCDNCGKDCEVPFKPTGNRPVLCNSCFKNKDERGFSDRQEKRPSFRENRDDKFSDKRPSFNHKESNTNAVSKEDFNELKRQLEYVNSKLDKVLKSLESKSSAPKVVAEAVTDAKPELSDVEKKIRKPRKAAAKKKSK